MNLDFLDNIKNTLESYFQPAASRVGGAANAITNTFLHQDKPPQLVSPVPQNQTMPAAQTQQPAQAQPPQQQPSGQDLLTHQIQHGFDNYSQPPVPAATMSGELAQAGSQLPDQLLPAVLALMESQGMSNPTTPNNMFNIGPGINYPDPRTAILGGGSQNQEGLLGILKSGLYDKYLQSGNLADFFQTFTPPGEQYGNPSMEELLSRYNQIRSLFTQ